MATSIFMQGTHFYRDPIKAPPEVGHLYIHQFNIKFKEARTLLFNIKHPRSEDTSIFTIKFKTPPEVSHQFNIKFKPPPGYLQTVLYEHTYPCSLNKASLKQGHLRGHKVYLRESIYKCNPSINSITIP